MIAGAPAIERARRYLASLPAAESGQGGDRATFRAASFLVQGFALDVDAAYALLSAEFNPRCRPPWSPSQLIHKVRSALVSPSSLPRGYLLGERVEVAPVFFPSQPPKWPEPDEEHIQRVVATGPTALELWMQSPYPLDVDDGSKCQEIVKLLFTSRDEPDPLICVGKNSATFATRRLSKWIASGKLPGMSLIVPSPMTSRFGLTKDGRKSEHTLDNTGSRRFLVIEFDTGSEDRHAARLWSLAQYGPLALVVHSGGKSLHGWYFCKNQSEEDLQRFMRLAVALGADRATWTRSQFVRLPGGLRETETRQSAFFFNPAAMDEGGKI